MNFKEQLKEKRKEKGLYQRQVAQLLNTKLYNISNWEQGRTEPSIDDLRKLCIVYNISADELLEIETAEERKKVVINNSFNNNTEKQNKWF